MPFFLFYFFEEVSYINEMFVYLQIIFALIPPAALAGGWPCFFVSLGMIGVLTAIVGDLAGIFGCLVGLKDSVTGNFFFIN